MSAPVTPPVSPLILAKIQRIGRAMLDRRAFGVKFASKIKVNRMVRRLRFAKRMQPLTAGYLARKNLILGALRAALQQKVMIQKIGRAYLVRKRMFKDLVTRNRLRSFSLKELQRIARGFIARRKCKRQRRLRAARRLERFGRGSICRKHLFVQLMAYRKRRLVAALKIQRCGRALWERWQLRMQMLEDLRRRRRFFFLYCRAPCDAYRARKALGHVWLRKRYQLLLHLATLCQRVGFGFFDRKFLAPRFHHRRRFEWLQRCAVLLQRCGRGYFARSGVFYLHAQRILKARRLAVRKRMMAATVAHIQRVCRAFQRRLKLFRKWFRRRMVKAVLCRVFRGYAVRRELFGKLHAPHVDRSRRDYGNLEGEGYDTLFALRDQQDDLYQELDELNWRVDELLNGNAYPVLKTLRNGPLARLEAEVLELRHSRRRLKNDLARAHPEKVSLLQHRLTAVNRDVQQLVAENNTLEAKLKIAESKLTFYADDLRGLEKLEGQRSSEKADAERQVNLIVGKAAAANHDASLLQKRALALEVKCQLVEAFEALPWKGHVVGAPRAFGSDGSLALSPSSLREQLTYDLEDAAAALYGGQDAPLLPTETMMDPQASPPRGERMARAMLPPVALTPAPGRAPSDRRLTEHRSPPPVSSSFSVSLKKQPSTGSVRLPRGSMRTSVAAFDSPSPKARRLKSVGLVFPGVSHFGEETGAAAASDSQASSTRGATTALLSQGSVSRILAPISPTSLISPPRRTMASSSLSMVSDGSPSSPISASSTLGTLEPGPWLRRTVVVVTERDINVVRLRLNECDALIDAFRAETDRLQRSVAAIQDRLKQDDAQREKADAVGREQKESASRGTPPRRRSGSSSSVSPSSGNYSTTSDEE